MWLPADLLQDYTCAVCEMFNLVKTSQIHLNYTEIKKTSHLQNSTLRF